MISCMSSLKREANFVKSFAFKRNIFQTCQLYQFREFWPLSRGLPFSRFILRICGRNQLIDVCAIHLKCFLISALNFPVCIELNRLRTILNQMFWLNCTSLFPRLVYRVCLLFLDVWFTHDVTLTFPNEWLWYICHFDFPNEWIECLFVSSVLTDK